jgi:hypothetical protein
MREIFEGFPAHFYPQVLVPVTEEGRTRLLSEYRKRVIPMLGKTLQPAEVDRIELQIEKMCESELIDFSFLSLELQKVVLQKISNPAYRKEVEEANAELLETLTYTMDERTVDKSSEIEERFGPEAHAAELRRILDSFGGQTRGGFPAGETSTAAVHGDKGTGRAPTGTEQEKRGGAIHQKVLSRFLELENMRLLYF